MKQSSITVLLLIFSVCTFAQPKWKYSQKNDGYVSAYSGGIYFSSPEPHGTVSFSFPYAQTNIHTGQVNNGIFNTSRNFSYNPVAPLFGLEVGGGRGFADLELGLFTSNWPNSGTFNIGGGVIYGLGHTKNISGKKHVGHGSPASDSRLLLKLSLNMNVTEHSFDLGSIDNYDYTISVLDHTAPSNYTVHSKYSFPEKHYAKQLDISYNDASICFLPKVTVCNNSFKNILSLSASCTYIFPMFQDSRVIFNQDNYNPAGASGVGSTGLTTLLNGVPFSKGPFIMQGIYISLSVGVNIGTGH